MQLNKIFVHFQNYTMFFLKNVIDVQALYTCQCSFVHLLGLRKMLINMNTYILSIINCMLPKAILINLDKEWEKNSYQLSFPDFLGRYIHWADPNTTVSRPAQLFECACANNMLCIYRALNRVASYVFKNVKKTPSL